MMNYEMFKGIVQAEFKKCLTGEFKDMEVRFSVTNKVNRSLDAITLISPDNGKSEGKTVSPSMYINEMYESYKNGENIQTVIEESAKRLMDEYWKGQEFLPKIEDVDTVKKHIIFQLINAAQNEELLRDAPHKEFEDLAIIFRVVVGNTPGEGISSSVITNAFAENLGLSTDELFKLAANNTKELFPIKISTMEEIMREIFSKDGMPEEMIDMMVPEMPEENKMYVITNVSGINGAGSILYEKELGELADKLGTNLFILPSSIHEVIAVPAVQGQDPMELADMVQQINMSQVALEDRLSNQVYMYDRTERKLSLVTDTPFKRLDGQNASVAEPKQIYETGKNKR